MNQQGAVIKHRIENRISGYGLTWRHFLMAAVAAIPIFFVAYFYTDKLMERDDEQAAFFITIYFLTGIFTGRYISQLLVARDGTVSRKILTACGIIILICTSLVVFLAQATLFFNLSFLRILFIGLPFTILGLTLGVAIKLVRVSISNQLTEAKILAETSNSELRFLQNQLSPHFLFNTLNNMYGISLVQHEKIPELLLKLADLLRYSVYDAREIYVPLQNELVYINDYIDFEKIRIGDKLVLTTSIEENIDPSVKIAPLLLIVFIENAFKHSKNTTEHTIYIDITLKVWANSILFSVKNSCGSKPKETSVLKSDSGYGLENVMKRLELLYPGKYDLKIEEKAGFYTVMLQLKTN